MTPIRLEANISRTAGDREERIGTNWLAILQTGLTLLVKEEDGEALGRLVG